MDEVTELELLDLLERQVMALEKISNELYLMGLKP